MKISIREFKAHLSRYLAQARQGITLEITSHRRIVARVTGVPESSTSALGGLITEAPRNGMDTSRRVLTSNCPKAAVLFPVTCHR